MNRTTDDENELLIQHRKMAVRIAETFAARGLPPTVMLDDVIAACWVGIWKAIRSHCEGRFVTAGLEGYAAKSAMNDARRLLGRERRRGFYRVPAGLHLRSFQLEREDTPQMAEHFTAPPEAVPHVPWSKDRWRRVLACLPPLMYRLAADIVFHPFTTHQVAKRMGYAHSTINRWWREARDMIRVAHPDIERELAS